MTDNFRHALEWTGRFHVLVVHFPIALLLTAAAVEAWALVRRDGVASPMVRCCLWLGTISAIVAAALGWPHAALGDFADTPSRTLEIHRWLGIAAAVVAVATTVALEMTVRSRLRPITFRVMLFALAMLIGITGHFGGMLTHGDDFLKW
jgi:uncharacterized membrane protein